MAVLFLALPSLSPEENRGRKGRKGRRKEASEQGSAGGAKMYRLSVSVLAAERTDGVCPREGKGPQGILVAGAGTRWR
jgi:hypothetical protein